MFHFMIINLCEFIIEWYKPRFYYVHFFLIANFYKCFTFYHTTLYHTEESMVDQNSVNAQPIGERAVYFSFLERDAVTYSGK